MERATSGAEYRKKRRKLITLPSGDKFLLKKPGKTALVELMDIFDTQVMPDEISEIDFDNMMEESEKKPLTAKQLARLIDVLFTHCVLVPKIVFEITEEDDEVWIEEIDPIDTTYLLKEIFVWIDMSPERIKETFFPGGQQAGESDRVGGTESGDKTVDDPEID